MQTLEFFIMKTIPQVGVRGLYKLDGVIQGNFFVSFDKFGKFPYEFGFPYFLKSYESPKFPFGRSLHIVTSQKSAFNERNLLIHVGNKHEESKGCILVGQSNNLDNDSLYLSCHTFQMLYNSIDDITHVLVKFYE